ncbi:MAG: hypothetical protein OXC66_03605 [Roseovarius sp.]|nr:hypothetical protein [Roseovarius sp.]
MAEPLPPASEGIVELYRDRAKAEFTPRAERAVDRRKIEASLKEMAGAPRHEIIPADSIDGRVALDCSLQNMRDGILFVGGGALRPNYMVPVTILLAMSIPSVSVIPTIHRPCSTCRNASSIAIAQGFSKIGNGLIIPTSVHWQVTLSRPGRAYLEMLVYLPRHESFDQADKLAEGAVNFSPWRF